MTWSISGRYFENCSCDVVCPCTASLALGADNDRCNAVLVFHVDQGEVEGVDVSDKTIVAVVDTPKFMHEGNWRLGVLVDEAASEEQATKLGAVFGGALGGPMAGLAPLVSEQLGVERVPMEFTSEDGHHQIRLGELGSLVADDVVPFGIESGQAVQFTNAFHPAAATLNVAKAGESSFAAFGLDFDLAAKSAFSASFAWAG